MVTGNTIEYKYMEEVHYQAVLYINYLNRGAQGIDIVALGIDFGSTSTRRV